MAKKEIHLICFLRFKWPVHIEKFAKPCNENINYGWKTFCGEVLWPEWKGTTERNRVTCQRCKKLMVKYRPL